MPPKNKIKLIKKVYDQNGNLLNGTRYRDSKTKIWYRVTDDGQRVALDLDREGNPIQTSYIGGTTNEARQKYWEQAPIMRHAVDSIGQVYGVPSDLIINRLNAEGFTDRAIRVNNAATQAKYTNFRYHSNYDMLNDGEGDPRDDPEGYDYFAGPRSGYRSYGLDSVGNLIQEGKVYPKQTNYTISSNMNESGMILDAAGGDTAKDNISLMAATLGYFRDLSAYRHPNNTEHQNNVNANMYYHRGQYTNYNNPQNYDYTTHQTK